MSRKRLAIIIVAVVIALYAGFKLLTRPKPIAVLVATVDSGRVETTVANTRAGSVAACRRARIAPSSAGHIAK